MPESTPVLDTIADMTAVSIERSMLSEREHMLSRIAALAAIDAPVASYLMNAGATAMRIPWTSSSVMPTSAATPAFMR